jgi:DNA-binding GntR family transcriptional regulator
LRGLSTQLAISPTPIREALRRLAAERGVEIVPNRFIRIPIMTSKELRELRDIRTSLEGIATERAVALLSTEDIAALRKYDTAIRKLREKRGTVKLIVGTIQQFHFLAGSVDRKPLATYCAVRKPIVSRLFPD